MRLPVKFHSSCFSCAASPLSSICTCTCVSVQISKG
jgi:hypothetical protein